MKFFNNGGKGSVPKRAEPGGALSRLLIKVYPNKTPSRNGQVRNGAVGNGEALKKRFLLLGGVTLGAAATLGVKYLANKWIKNGKSSNGAVDSLEMTADYAPDSPGTVAVYPKGSPPPTLAHSNGAAAIVAPVSTATVVAPDIPRKGDFRSKFGVLAPLKDWNFAMLMLGRSTSNMGRSMRVYARALLVLELTGSPLLLGLVTSSLSWPMLVLPFLGGILADRIDRRKLLLFTEFSLAALWIATSIIITMGLIQWWHLMITGVMSGILQGIGRPGHEAMLGNVVNDKEKLPGAVAIDAAAHHWPSEIGLVLATLFYAALGTDGVFWITSIGQTITGFTLLFLKWEPAGEPEARRHSVRSNFMEGIRYVKNEPVILGLVLLSVVSSIFAGSYGFLLVFFARDVLDKGAHGLGMLMILNSLGVSIGSVAVIAMSNFPRRGVMLMLAALGYTFFILAFSLSEDFLLSLGLVFFMGLFATCSRTMMTMIMQLLAPNEMRGRVMSVRVSLMGLTWIGTLWMGTLAEYITVPTTVLIGGGLYGALALILFATRPQLRNFK